MRKKTVKEKRQAYWLGIWSEHYASLILFLKGYRIVKRRYRVSTGEIDIIAIKKKMIIFIEVKRRLYYKDAVESISYKNRRRVENAARHFLHTNSEYAHYDIRFDAFFVYQSMRFCHLQNAWRLEE